MVKKMVIKCVWDSHGGDWKSDSLTWWITIWQGRIDVSEQRTAFIFTSQRAGIKLCYEILQVFIVYGKHYSRRTKRTNKIGYGDKLQFVLYCNPLWHINYITDQTVNKTQCFHILNINYGMFRPSRPSAGILVLGIIKHWARLIAIVRSITEWNIILYYENRIFKSSCLHIYIYIYIYIQLHKST